MDKYAHFISIGYVCSVPALIFQMGKRSAAYAFDNMAIPMWGVAELIENNFDGFLSDLEPLRLFEDSDETFLTDKRYYARFASGTISTASVARENAIKRVERLLQLLSETTEPVLFIRCEEQHEYDNRGQRIARPEYAEKYSKDEKHWINVFANALKQKYPQLNFKVLFLTSQESFVINNVVAVQAPHFDYRNIRIGALLNGVLEHNKEWLSANL